MKQQQVYETTGRNMHKQKRPLLALFISVRLIMLPTLCCLLATALCPAVSALIVQTSLSRQRQPPTMTRKERKRVMNSIWICTQKDREKPEHALRLLEMLLRDEEQQSKSSTSPPKPPNDVTVATTATMPTAVTVSSSSPLLLKRGVVWNVLRSCSRLYPLDDLALGRLETTMELLEQNPRLYHVNMTEFVVTTLEKNQRPHRARAIMDRHTAMLLGTKHADWSPSLLLTAKNAIWFHLYKNVDTVSQDRRHRGSPEKALLLLERLLEQDTNGLVLSKGMMFNVLRACQQHPVVSSLHVLENIVPLAQHRNLLDAKMLTEVLVTMTKCHDSDKDGNNEENAMQRAEALLKEVASTTTVTAVALQPNVYHYCSVLNGYAKRGHAKQAEQLLQSMMTDRHIPSPNTVACNCVLDALCKAGSSSSNSSETRIVDRAEHLLKQMKQDRRGGTSTAINPDMVSYSIMLRLYAKHAMGEKAESLLEEVLTLEDANTMLTKEMNEQIFRCVIDALAKSGQTDKAKDLLVARMRERNVMPNKFHYCGVMNGYAREGRPFEAERLLHEMQKDRLNPNVVAYNCVMYAWAKSGEVDAPFRAKTVLDEMVGAGIAPNVITYNCLLCAFANRSMAKEAEHLLKQMRQLNEAGELDFPPNKISYHYVLDALARSGDRVWTVLRAESLISEMEELSEPAGVAETKPIMCHYRSLLKCYANWNLAQDADQLLCRMKGLHKSNTLEYGPDRLSYRVVIDALGASEDEEAKKRAEELKKEVEEKFKTSWNQEAVIDVADSQLDALLQYMRE